MHRKILGLIAALAMAVSLVGVAWAGTDDQSAAADSNSTTVDDSTSTSIGDDTTSTSVDDTTPTTDDDDDGTTSTTIVDTTSTSVDVTTPTTDDDDDGTTSTTIDDEDDHAEQNEEIFDSSPVDSDIPGVGSVSVEIVAGRLELVNVSAPGWDIRIKNAESDEIKVEFRNGSDEAEFEAELEAGRIKIEIERESS